MDQNSQLSDTDSVNGREKTTSSVNMKIGNIAANPGGNVNIAAGDITIIQQAPAQIPVIASPLFTIPSHPSDFTGRQEEIDQLLSSNPTAPTAIPSGQDNPFLVGITGSGGIGKTALARSLAQRLSDQYSEARLEIDLRGTTAQPIEPEEAMRRLLGPFFPGQKLPDNPNDLHGLYQQTMRSHKALLLLDNAANPAQVRPLLPDSPSAAIFTSRLNFTIPERRVKPLRLGLLSKTESMDFLRQVSMRLVSEPEEQVLKLAESCGFLPLALRVSASLYESREDWDMERFLKKLSDERTRLEALRSPDDPDLDVKASLELSYQALPDGIKTFFRQLAVFAAPFTIEALAAVWDCELPSQESSEGEEDDTVELTEEADAALGVLLNRQMLEYNADTQEYALQDLTRIFARSLLAASEGEVRLTLDRYIEYYLDMGNACNELYQEGGENVVLALNYFAIIWPHLAACWRRLTKKAPGWPLPELADRWLCDFPGGVGFMLDLHLSPQAKIPFLESAIAAAQRLGDQKAEGSHLVTLGNAWSDQGYVHKALDYYTQSLEVNRASGNQSGEIASLGSLGNAWSDLDDLDKALTYYNQGLEIARQSGEKRMEGQYWGNLGNIYRKQGETDKALEHYNRALEIDREIGDRLNEATWLGNQGSAWLDQGEIQKAIEAFQHSLEITREISDEIGEGTRLGNLGDAYINLGDTDKAIDYYKQALVIDQSNGNKSGEAADLGGLGQAYQEQEDHLKATEYFQQALQVSHEIGDQNKELLWCKSLFQSYQILGEYDKANEFYEQVLNTLRQLGDRLGEGEFLADIGTWYDSTGEKERARSLWQEALIIYQETDDPNAGIIKEWLGELDKN